ncbi:MAG: OmpH family outer membrane protein [Saprospiraceae bacterium]
MKKYFIFLILLTSIIACKRNASQTNNESANNQDSTSTSVDTSSVEIDSLAPVKNLIPKEGLPQGAKIVYVNIDTLQEKYQYFIDENKTVQYRLTQFENELKAKENAIITAGNAMQERYQEIQSKAQTLTPNEIKAAEMELQEKDQKIMKMQEDYQKYKDAKQEELLKKQDQLNQKIRKRIDTFLQEVAENNGWDYILTYSDITNPVLYGSKKFDVTQQIIIGLNEDYKSIKK